MTDLAQQLKQKMAELATLREIGRALNAAWELKATLELITGRTAAVMGMDSCSIYLLDENREWLVLKATTGLAPTAVGRARLRLGEGLTGWAAQMGEPVGVADAAHDPRFKLLPETNEVYFQSLLAVPLRNQDRIIGAMNVQTKVRHEYGIDEVELLSLIADLAAGALEKAMLYERMQRQITELSTLAKISETVISAPFHDEMLELIVEMSARVMRAKVCSLLLLDEARGGLVPRAMHSSNPAYRAQPPIRVGEGIAGLVTQTGHYLTVEDVRRDERYQYRDIARQLGLCSLLCMPLRVRERVIGVLNCYTDSPHHFTESEIALCSTLANQMALAIENGRLATNAAIIREMHHRIKNNLQSVIMLLRLQMGKGEAISAPAVLQEAINRIQSIAAVHEELSQKGLQLVDVRGLLTRVARGVVQNMAPLQFNLDLSVQGETFALPSQPATSLALVINELVQNAVEHAFVGRATGRIVVELDSNPDQWIIAVRDDGVGLPERPARQVGLQIAEALVVEDLHGELRMNGGAGTTAIVVIPRR